jgi:hypothetical protein
VDVGDAAAVGAGGGDLGVLDEEVDQTLQMVLTCFTMCFSCVTVVLTEWCHSGIRVVLQWCIGVVSGHNNVSKWC